MIAYERIIAQPLMPESKSILWLNTSVTPNILFRYENGCWRAISPVDLSGVAKQGDNPEATISRILELVEQGHTTEIATEGIVRAMWGRGFLPTIDNFGYFVDLNMDDEGYIVLDNISIDDEGYLQLIA